MLEDALSRFVESFGRYLWRGRRPGLVQIISIVLKRVRGNIKVDEAQAKTIVRTYA